MMIVRVCQIQMGNSQSTYTELIKESVIGYKAFLQDFSCRGFKYEVGQTYEMPAEKKIKLGESGFHFCRIPDDCKKYYPITATTRYAKVEAWDSIHTVNNSVARKIRIVEELTFEQFLTQTGIFTTTDRTIHMKDGKLHREEDLPAVEYANGDVEYWINGERHREGNQPAIIKANGDQYWYQRDKLHRIGGPAVKLLANGTEMWYENGQLHRIGGPAVTHKNGDYTYYIRDKCHNSDGPAISSKGMFGITHRWFLDGQEYELDTKKREYADPNLKWIAGKCYKQVVIYDNSYD